MHSWILPLSWLGVCVHLVLWASGVQVSRAQFHGAALAQSFTKHLTILLTGKGLPVKILRYVCSLWLVPCVGLLSNIFCLSSSLKLGPGHAGRWIITHELFSIKCMCAIRFCIMSRDYMTWCQFSLLVLSMKVPRIVQSKPLLTKCSFLFRKLNFKWRSL